MSKLTDDQYPMQHHPAYDGMADGIRSLMGDGRSFLRVPVVRRVSASFTSDEDTRRTTGFTDHTLTVRKAYGPAPYVGKPFVYMWYVAVDEVGRSVGGPSWIEYPPDDPRFPQ